LLSNILSIVSSKIGKNKAVCPRTLYSIQAISNPESEKTMLPKSEGKIFNFLCFKKRYISNIVKRGEDITPKDKANAFEKKKKKKKKK